MTEPAQESAPLGVARRLLGSVWLRVAVTAALLAIVALQIDWATMEDRLRHGHVLDFAIAVGLLVVALGVGVWRWRLLLAAAGIPLSAARCIRVYAVSTFSSTFLPTSVGGDVARALLVARRGRPLARAATTVVVDRAAALVGLVALAWLAFALNRRSVPTGATTFLGLVTLAIGVAGTVAAAALFRGAGAFGRLVPTRLRAVTEELWSLLGVYARSPRLMLAVVTSSVVFQALVALQIVMLANAINVDLPFATAAVALALVTVVTLIPVSIGGFGVREGTYVVLLGGASISATDATLISVLTVAALLLASLPGAYLLARGGLAPALETATAP